VWLKKFYTVDVPTVYRTYLPKIISVALNLTKKLFSPLGKVAGRAIYFACINFFLFKIFLMISRQQIISKSLEPIFAIFSSNESVLGVDDRPGPLF